MVNLRAARPRGGDSPPVQSFPYTRGCLDEGPPAQGVTRCRRRPRHWRAGLDEGPPAQRRPATLTSPTPRGSTSLDEGPPAGRRLANPQHPAEPKHPCLDEGPPAQRAATRYRSSSRPRCPSLDEGPPAQGRRQAVSPVIPSGLDHASMKGRPLRGRWPRMRMGKSEMPFAIVADLPLGNLSRRGTGRAARAGAVCGPARAKHGDRPRAGPGCLQHQGPLGRRSGRRSRKGGAGGRTPGVRRSARPGAGGRPAGG